MFMPHMANLPWLEIYITSCALFLMMAMKMKSKNLSYQQKNNDNKFILFFWPC